MCHTHQIPVHPPMKQETPRGPGGPHIVKLSQNVKNNAKSKINIAIRNICFTRKKTQNVKGGSRKT